jgi:antirestriction protein ArdC
LSRYSTPSSLSRRSAAVLKDDKRAIFTAASHAQKAADYLHDLQSREAQYDPRPLHSHRR